MGYFLAPGTSLHSGNHIYIIQSVLGVGGFGITYKATVSTTLDGIPVNAVVAIKEHFLKADCERDEATHAVNCSQPARMRVERSRRDFAGEARRLQSVAPGQNNIVQVSEVFDANNTTYYVMEYLEGQTLAEYVNAHGPLSEKVMCGIMLPIVRAVGHLHRNRITHLDIKPANIMLTADSKGNIRPVLIDFGLSKHYNADGSATSTINIQGFSDGYAPVEQYVGITTFSPVSDVYALAATMMFCLTGKVLPKSVDLSPEELQDLIPVSVSQRLRTALTYSLKMKSKDRPADANAMLAMLTEGKTKPPTPPTPRPDDNTRISDGKSKKRLLILILIIALVCGGGCLWYFQFYKDGEYHVRFDDIESSEKPQDAYDSLVACSIAAAQQVEKMAVQTNESGSVSSGRYHLSGYVGEYPIKADLVIDNYGNVSGTYCYDSTIRKYGDVPANYFYFEGNVYDNGVFVLNARLYDHSEIFEYWRLQYSDGTLSGYLENSDTGTRCDVTLS